MLARRRLHDAVEAGLDWAYDLSGVGAGYALSGNNIACDTHIYTAFHDTSATWSQGDQLDDLGLERPRERTEPSVLADWSGTPLAGQGQLIHDTLAAPAG